jgi:serine/threonine-protein kinase
MAGTPRLIVPAQAYDSDSAREFLQARLAFYARFMLSLIVSFWIVGNALLLPTAGASWRLAFTAVPNELHFVEMAIFGSVWLICRRGERPQRLLWALDALAQLGVAAVHVAMAFLHAYVNVLGRGNLPVIVGMLLILHGRAVLVPSTARRTAILGAAALLPALAAGHWVARQGSPVPAAVETLTCTMFAVTALALAVIVSHVIYGLRAEVRAARRLGRYTLEELIGKGGMGAVYRASHAMLRRPTAVKLLPPERAGEQNLDRFEREVQLTSRLTHPNTVAIYDYGRTPEGIFYYAMEYLDGIDLAELVRLDGPLPPGRVIHVLVQVCNALAEAHAIGLIHRDIKPANILLCERGRVSDMVKVVDFGLVKELHAGPGANVTQADAITGTPLYLSPEAIAGAKIDARADLYAVGAVGFFLLTGTPVFDGATVMQVCAHHLHTAPPRPSERARRPLPGDLEAVVLACLEKEPARRPADAEALAARLAACAAAAEWTGDDAKRWWRERGAGVRAVRAAAAGSPPPHDRLEVTRTRPAT